MRESVQRKKLVEYIKRNLKKGYTLEALRWALINQDYSKVLIQKAIDEANKDLAKEAPVLKEKPRITYQVIDEDDKPITIKKSFWRRMFG